MIRRNTKIGLCCYILFPIVVYLIIFPNQGSSSKKFSVNLENVVVHLDLKGAPPKMWYLMSLLPTLAENGVNGILLEYEDMFPYQERLVNLSARYHYTSKELTEFINVATINGIEIIPLVQTFGHIEFALKLQEFMHLREVEEYPDSICPSNPQSINLIENMLQQVISFHNSIVPLKHIHVGCDEVYNINKCPLCRGKNLDEKSLFLKHVQEINQMVKKLSPNTNVLIWADMLSSNTLKSSFDRDITNIEVVIWNYASTLWVSHADLYNQHKTFKNIWIASAFKGAEGNTASLPSLKTRFLNHYSWLKFISNYKFGGETEVYKFKGIILTGWSRYTHMNHLCELLPASMPSLLLNLLLIKTFKEGIDHGDLDMNYCTFFNKYLKTEFSKLGILKYDTNSTCSFEMNDFYKTLKNIFNVKSHISQLSQLQFVQYSLHINNENPVYIPRYIKSCKTLLYDLSLKKRSIEKFMHSTYKKAIIEEYVYDKLYFIEREVKNKLDIFQNYSEIRSWGRRPHSVT